MQITLKDKAKIDFLTLLIDEGCTIYIFRCKSKYDKYCYITNNDKIVKLEPSKSYRIISASDLTDGIDIELIWFKNRNDNTLEFSFKDENKEELFQTFANDIRDYDYLKLVDKETYIKQFFKLSRSVLSGNYQWETIDYRGLFVRYKHYYQRYSDFGYHSYKISIIGNPSYISPYKKKAIEIDFFDDERTRVNSYYPNELFSRDEVQSLGGGIEIVKKVLSKAFDYFFDNKKFVAINYDEVKTAAQGFLLPNQFPYDVYVLSLNNIDTYMAGY